MKSISLKFNEKKTVAEAIQNHNTLRVDDLEDELVTYVCP